MKFDSVEEAENFLKNSEKTIKEAKEYIDKFKITEEDIRNGVAFCSSSGYIFVIPVRTGWDNDTFYLSGNNDKVTCPYSTKPLSIKEMIEYLTDGEYSKSNMKLGLISR